MIFADFSASGSLELLKSILLTLDWLLASLISGRIFSFGSTDYWWETGAKVTSSRSKSNKP